VTQEPTGVLDKFLSDLSNSLAKGIGNVLVNGRAPDRVEATARTSADIHDRTIAGLMPMIDPPPPPLACQRGCSYCCHVQVVTDVPTVIRLASHIRETFSPLEQEELHERIVGRLAKLDALPDAERRQARLPCPLLVDDACTVYEARPLICRSFNSFDAEACEREIFSGRSDRNIPAFDVPLRVGIALAKAMDEGLASAGRGDSSVELVRALLIALDEPDAATKWLSGSDLFAPARFRAYPS
jgi:Fe-S-cluster containining protein